MSHCIACEVEILLSTPPPPTGGGGPGACKLCFYLPQMTERDRAAITHGLTGALGTGKIASIMSSHGYPVSKAAVQRHQAHSRTEPTTA
jgi:hypothetical protein